MKNEKILVTGGTGFIGRHVVKKLIELGVNVKIITRQKANSMHQNIEYIYTNNAFEESIDWWGIQCKDISRVVHMAWYVEPGLYLDSLNNIECLEGSIKIAIACTNAKITKFVGIGTCFEYDLMNVNHPIKSNSKLNPQTLYAATKASLFLILLNLFSKANIKFSWARIFYLYGEGEDTRRFLPYLRNQLSKGLEAQLTTGEQVRDFIDVEVAALKIIEVLFNDNIGPENICSGIEVTIKQFAEKVADEYGRRDLLKFGIRKPNLTDPGYVVGFL